MSNRLTVTALAIACFFAAGISQAVAEQVRIATEGAYPPFNEVNSDGDLVGFDVDIAKALCEAMDAECTIVAQDWDGIIPGLLSEKYDAIVASMSITDERKEQVNFTDKYYETPVRFIADADAGIEISEAGLDGKIIGAQRGTTGSNHAEETYGEVAEVRLYDTFENGLLDLTAGRIDAFAADGIPLGQWLATEDGAGYEFVGDPVKVDDGIGIAIRLEDTNLLDQFNEALAQILSDGTYEAISVKYFDFNIYE